MNKNLKRKFILLDRDGTIIEWKNYLNNPDQVQLIPHAAEGLKSFIEMGFGLIVVTNQSGIARGYYSEDTLKAVHQRMNEELKKYDVVLDDIFYCPHKPEDNCECYKPKTGLVEQAARKYGFNPSECYVIGDNICDIGLAKKIKAVSILVRTGYGCSLQFDKNIKPDYFANDLKQGAEIIKKLERMD
jgi:D-glycero-D-manno-heptose 1,7-bisphosphate phosphatase